MRQWYISVKLSIWLARLYKSHRVVVDDSYNIRSGSTASEEEVGSDIKKEVLFDVTDYKMKNQVRSKHVLQCNPIDIEYIVSSRHTYIHT